MKEISTVFLLFILIFPVAVSAGDPVPSDDFIEITGKTLNKIEVLADDATQHNFSQLRNAEVHSKFDEIRTSFKEYEKYTSNDMDKWPEGRQKNVASALLTANFFYRAYSLSQNKEYRENAEISLHKAQALFRDYIRSVKTHNKGFID